MSWIRSSLPSMSISDWLAARPATARPCAALEDAREALLGALGDASGPGTLERRIRRAADVHALWHLRAEVMTAIARLHGEREGRRRIDEATARFGALRIAPGLTGARRRHGMSAAHP